MSRRARWPVKKRYIGLNDSADVATCTCVWFGTVTFSAPVISLPAVPRPAQMARVGTPPGGAAAVRPSMFTYLRMFAARAGVARYSCMRVVPSEWPSTSTLSRPVLALTFAIRASRLASTCSRVLTENVESYSRTLTNSCG